MNKKELKKLHPGQVLYLLNYPVTLKGITSAGVSAKDDQAEGSDGNWCYFPAKYIATEPIAPANGIKNTEPAPKYDPNRLFRKGDKVKPRERNGRIPWAKDMTLTVVADESKAGVTVRDEETGEERLMCVLFLKLVTPVEELEISRVFNDKKMGAWIVTKDNFTHAYFPYRCEVSDNIANSKEEAKARAEAERDRLNAEYRKEQECTRTCE